MYKDELLLRLDDLNKSIAHLGIKATTIEKLAKDEFFTLKPVAEPKQGIVYCNCKIYDRSSKKYSAYRFADVNHYIYKKKGTVVYINFTF